MNYNLEKFKNGLQPVSYTHLDVYKRQILDYGFCCSYCSTVFLK